MHVRLIEDLARLQTGRKISLPYKMTAEKCYDGILLDRSDLKTGEKEDAGNEPGVHMRMFEQTAETGAFPKKTYTKWFDYDKIKKCLEIRGRKPGDYLEINRAHGRKKLKAYLIDEKVPASERDELLLLADGAHIVWIPGHRISEAYKVTEETKNILKVQISGGNEHG